MDDTSLSISEFLLKRLAQQSIAHDLLDEPEEAKTLPASLSDLPEAEFLLEPPQVEKEAVNRAAAQRAYTKAMDGEPYSLGEIRA